MDVKFNPGLEAMGISSDTVQKLLEAQKIPVQMAKQRKEKIGVEKEAVESLNKLLSDLSTSLNGLKRRTDFFKLKLDSSHPDIIDGSITGEAMLGTYELEVRSLARSDKELAFGFPDKDETPVGLGYMMIRRDDGEPIEIEVAPDTTLQQLTNQINDAGAGVKAMVINTKYLPDPYRLLVISEASGREANVYIDPDTTFLEFQEQVTGRNLDVLFEDVPVTDDTNQLNELISGVSLAVRRSEPGTRVQVSVLHDVEATLGGIKTFVETYNAVTGFINSQYKEDSKTGKYGILASDSTVKTVMRNLQSGLVSSINSSQKYRTLAEIGIISDAKTGQLQMDETKVKAALAEDYESVARLFIKTQHSMGVAEALAEKLRLLRDPGGGAVKGRLRGLKQMIDNQDKEIERRERELEVSESSIKRRFTALESTLSGLKGKGDFLKARLGGGGQ